MRHLDFEQVGMHKPRITLAILEASMSRVVFDVSPSSSIIVGRRMVMVACSMVKVSSWPSWRWVVVPGIPLCWKARERPELWWDFGHGEPHVATPPALIAVNLHPIVCLSLSYKLHLAHGCNCGSKCTINLSESPGPYASQDTLMPVILGEHTNIDCGHQCSIQNILSCYQHIFSKTKSRALSCQVSVS